MGVEQTRAGGNKIRFDVGTIPIGQTFVYEIRYESNVFEVSINDGSFIQLPTFDLDAPASYFKCGNYLQGDVPSDIHFFSIDVKHSSTPILPSWPPAGATASPRSGIGPFNFLVAVDHTVRSSTLPNSNC